MTDYHGTMRMADGSRKAMTAEEAKVLWDAIKTTQKNRAEHLPDARSCLTALYSAKERLRELGWRESTYCPRDGSVFAVCEIGSTGMWTAFFADPYIQYADCVSSPGRAMFFKPMDQLSDDEKDTVQKGDMAVADEIERMGEAFS